MGIALYPEHAGDAATLVRQADLALDAIRSSGRAYAIYSSAPEHSSAIHSQQIVELRHAIGSDQLLLYYQPQVHFRDPRTVHMEALVRWRHPTRGLVLPDTFIPLAERTGMIEALTTAVLNEALREQRAWHEAGCDATLAVNVSATLVHDPHLPELISRLLGTWGTDAEKLEIEITESGVMADPTNSVEALTRLHDMGVQIAIDDFGTGHSSLAYLRSLPVDELKIDKSFVRDMLDQEYDSYIVRSVIDLAHKLGLQVVAEGVETREVWDVLATMGCDLAQGFYLSRPLAADDAREWLAQAHRVSQVPQVLVVDDDILARTLLAAYIRRFYCSPLMAAGPEEALDILERDRSVALVLSDVHMPTREAGVEFMRTVRTQRPELPLAAITSHPGDLADLHGTPHGPVLILAKPVQRRQIQEVLRLALSSPPLAVAGVAT